MLCASVLIGGLYEEVVLSYLAISALNTSGVNVVGIAIRFNLVAVTVTVTTKHICSIVASFATMAKPLK